MIVVDQDDDVGFLASDPYFGGFVTGEYGSPVRFSRLAEVQPDPDRRHVRGSDPCRDPSHDELSSFAAIAIDAATAADHHACVVFGRKIGHAGREVHDGKT